MATSWSLDFCLVCDCQTLGGAYCSQACRLSELDRSSSGSEPSSPTTSQPWTAIDFTTSKPSLPFEITPFSTKALSPSSSQTSLSSLASMTSASSTSTSSSSSQPSAAAWSYQIETELRNYAGSFDQVRDWKRRLTSPLPASQKL